jgi:hypothetical protein
VGETRKKFIANIFSDRAGRIVSDYQFDAAVVLSIFCGWPNDASVDRLTGVQGTNSPAAKNGPADDIG